MSRLAMTVAALLLVLGSLLFASVSVSAQPTTPSTSASSAETGTFVTTITLTGSATTSTVTGSVSSAVSSSVSSSVLSSTATESTTAASSTTAAPTAAPTGTFPGAGNQYPGVFACNMTGAEEVPSVATSANGTFFLDFSIDPTGAAAAWNVTVTGITNPTALVLQYGPSGIIGPIITTLFETPAGIFSSADIADYGDLTELDILTFINSSPVQNFTAFGSAVEAGEVYVNLMTSLKDPTTAPIGEPGNAVFGELRCQLVPYTGAPTTNGGRRPRLQMRKVKRMLPQMPPTLWRV